MSFTKIGTLQKDHVWLGRSAHNCGVFRHPSGDVKSKPLGMWLELRERSGLEILICESSVYR